MVEYSGGTSTDIILKLVGGTTAVTQFIHKKLGIQDIQVDRSIDQAFSAMGLNGKDPKLVNLEAVDDGVSDKATPKAIDLFFRKIFKGQVINKEHSDLFFDMLTQSRTLDPKVQITGLKKQNKVGNKTGTVPGVLNHCVLVAKFKNEAGIAGKIVISVFIRHKLNNKDGKITREARMARMGEGAKLISAAVNGAHKIARELSVGKKDPNLEVTSSKNWKVRF